VLGEKRAIRELLLGRPLAECLRWSQGAGGLCWQRAA
jgi:hypothetical protein